MSSIPGATSYRVIYADSKGVDHVERVAIIEGYSTIDDIEKILRNKGRDVANLDMALCQETGKLTYF